MTEKLSKLHSFDRQYRRPQKCPFPSSFTHRTKHFTQGIPVSSVYLRTPLWHHLRCYQLIQQMSIGWYISFQTPLLTPYFTHYFLLSDKIMANVAGKQQTTALFLYTTVTSSRRHTQLTQKTDKPDGKPVLFQRTFRSVQLFTQLNCTV
jgi:hypothetical protein